MLRTTTGRMQTASTTWCACFCCAQSCETILACKRTSFTFCSASREMLCQRGMCLLKNEADITAGAEYSGCTGVICVEYMLEAQH